MIKLTASNLRKKKKSQPQAPSARWAPAGGCSHAKLKSKRLRIVVVVVVVVVVVGTESPYGAYGLTGRSR